MQAHLRSAYRWNGTKVDPDVVRDNEEQLERLLRQARARNAAGQSPALSSLEDWPSPGRRFVWHPHLAEGAKRRHRQMPTVASEGAVSQRVWRCVVWLLLITMTGLACLPFGGEVARLAAAVL